MCKVVLLAINSKYVHTALSVRVIAAGIREYARLPHEVTIVEATIHNPLTEVADSVAESCPDVVGISTYIWNAEWLTGFLPLLREKLPGALFVLGGPEASFNADYWLMQGADHVLPGEGEYTFPAFLDNAPLPSPGPQLAETSYEPVDPYPDVDPGSLSDRILYLETSRGCPFKCAFCLSAGSGVRFFPIDFAKHQLYKLSRSGARTVKLVDRTFNCNADRAYELFEYVIEMDTECRFHFEVAADLFDEKAISLLRTAPPGRIQFEAGLQSFYMPAIDAVSRKTDLDKSERNIRALLLSGNIHVHVDLIAGLPHESMGDFMDSFDRAYSLGAHTLQLGFLKLLHGSALRGQAETLGIEFSERPPYEILSSPWLSAEDIMSLKQTENSLQHTYNKGRFLSALKYVFAVSALRPFSLFNGIGKSSPNHGADLTVYAGQFFDFCAGLPNVDKNELCDRMLCDWLSMVKGKNMPHFLRKPDDRSARVLDAAGKRLGRVLRRDEAASLLSGKCVFVDSENRDPVTGLYKVEMF